MSRAEKLSKAILNIDDSFLTEALEYKKKRKLYKQLLMAAACMAAVVGLILWGVRSSSISVTVYGYETDVRIGKELTLTSGYIDPENPVYENPLRFYVQGNEIAEIRFSCESQWIYFIDWTGVRGDYGMGKNFTVTYGENEDEYYYLEVGWVPMDLIETLQEGTSFSDLTEEEREDVIVMEITYLDGSEETAAVNIVVQEDGIFEASVNKYMITDDDEFVFQEDSYYEEGTAVRDE